MKFKIFILFLGCIACTRSKITKDLSSEVQKLCDDYFAWRMEDMPEFATFVGIHTYDNLFDDLSLEKYESRFTSCRTFIETIDIYMEQYTEHDDLVNLEVMRADIMTFVDGYQYKGFLVPVNFADGPHEDLPRLFGWMVLETENDYNVMIERLDAIDLLIDQTITLMKTGVSEGIVNHNLSMKGVASALDAFDVAAEQSPYHSYFTTFPENFTSDVIDDIQTRAKDVLNNKVAPSYGKLRDYVNNEYVTRPDIAVTSLPNGEQFYAQLIKFHTSSEQTPEQIHQKGLDEVDRIEGIMSEIVSELGYNLTVAEFSDMIKNDPNNFYDNPDDLMAHFTEYVYETIYPRIPDIFINVPKAELKVVADPSPNGAGAYYLAGSYDGTRPGVFYVNTYHYEATPKYEIMTLSLHEGNPGHHLQGSHNLESPNMPYYRSVMDDRKYGVAPSRFPINTFYGEGWGLYSESLGFEMNLYDDLLERYGHHSDEIFRACRLVVDTGMHALGWTRQEAIDYMYMHTAMSKVDVENEIDRYITWPGQALAYKTGEIKFLELRTKAEQELGDLYDIKEFHDVILEAYGPMSVVEDEVDRWIQMTLNSTIKHKTN